MLNSPVSSSRVEEKVHAKYKDDIRVDDGRREYRSKYTSHFFSYNTVNTVGGGGRIVYRSHTKHSSFKIGDSRGDSARRGSRYQEITHSSLFNVGESVDVDGRSGYRFHTIPYPYQHPCELVRSSGFIPMVMIELDIGL